MIYIGSKIFPTISSVARLSPEESTQKVYSFARSLGELDAMRGDVSILKTTAPGRLIFEARAGDNVMRGAGFSSKGSRPRGAHSSFQ